MSRLRDSLARKLRAARTGLGMSQQQVADFVGIPRSAVSEIETGDREVSAIELQAFSRLFGLSVEHLIALPPGKAAVERLVLRSSGKKEGNRAGFHRFFEICAAYQDLEDKLGGGRMSDVRAVEKPLLRIEDAEQLAEQERRRLDLGVTPGRQLMSVLEETVGVKVVALDLDDAMSGAAVRDAYFGAAILLNRRHIPGRQVFTLAHEYFHLLTHGHVAADAEEAAATSDAEDGDVHVNEVRPRGSGKTRVEQFADQFAGHLLMPREHLLQCVQRLVRDDGTVNALDLVGIARYFGVSVQAVFRRLAVLGAISHGMADQAYSDATLQDEILRTAGAGAPEPARFKRLAVKAHTAGLVTKERLADLLGVSKFEVDREVRRHGGGSGLMVPVKIEGKG